MTWDLQAPIFESNWEAIRDELISNGDEARKEQNMPQSSNLVGDIATKQRFNKNESVTTEFQEECAQYRALEQLNGTQDTWIFGVDYISHPCRYAGVNYPNVWKHFPALKKATDSADEIDELDAVYILTMKHKCVLNWHRGLNPVWRRHMALICPDEGTGFETKFKQYELELGKFTVSFNNTSYHRAWNNTDEQRSILVIDKLL